MRGKKVGLRSSCIFRQYSDAEGLPADEAGIFNAARNKLFLQILSTWLKQIQIFDGYISHD